MPNRDDHRGFGGRGPEREHDRWRQDEELSRSGPGERRWFGEPGRPGPDQARYGSRQDQDRGDYGSGFDRQGGGYGRGQEYGMEAGRGGTYREPPETDRDRAVEQYGQPADYAFRPGGDEQEPHEHDHDFRMWRDQQMRNHDRDYQEWRQAQHKQYNDEYQSFRNQRREHFGQRFEDWRRTRGTAGGVAESSVTPGMSGAGQHNTNAGEFGKEPAAVQATSEGKFGRDASKDDNKH